VLTEEEEPYKKLSLFFSIVQSNSFQSPSGLTGTQGERVDSVDFNSFESALIATINSTLFVSTGNKYFTYFLLHHFQQYKRRQR
jgi:hypothetical protein